MLVYKSQLKQVEQFGHCFVLIQLVQMNCLLNSQNSSEETSGAGTWASMERVKHENFCRADAEDNTALLLSAVGNFKKEALCRVCKGSDAATVLDQEMSARLLHLACNHNAVECASLLLEGGSGITTAPIDARDELTPTSQLRPTRPGA